MTTLEALLKRVRAAKLGSEELDAQITDLLNCWTYYHVKNQYGPGMIRKQRTLAYSTSLDAIVGLIERRLPGWFGDVDIGAPCRSGLFGARLFKSDHIGNVAGEAPTKALALCIAFLEALIAQEKEGGK